MAECSYAKCVQQRRNIRRDLQRWTKNMVHIVGLERIAEELMGRRKWKIYQDSMSRSYLQPLNNNIKRTSNPLSEDDCYQHHHKENNIQKSRSKSSSVETEGEHKDQDEDATVPGFVPREEEDVKEDEIGSEKPNLTDTGAKENERTTCSADNEPDEEEDSQNCFKDWTPQSKCYFCVDGKLDSEHAVHGVLSPRHSDSDSSESRSDNEDTRASSPYRLSRKRKFSQTGSLQTPLGMTSVDVALAVAALTGGAAPPGGAAGGLPYFTPSMLTHNWYLANVARQFQNAAPAPSEVDKLTSGEQPLDLSKGASNNNSNDSIKIDNNVRLPTLDSKQIFNSDFRAKPRMSAVAGRRTYTEDELQAALRDIQSGKLGTRRAAVIYGIPRSTLRNKVYKLALERERESHLNSSTPPNIKLEDDEVMDDDKELSGAEEEKEVEKALQAPLLSIMDLLRFGSEQPEALKIFLQKAKESPDSGPEQAEVIHYIQALIASQNIMASQKQTEGTVLSHLIPGFTKRVVTEEQLVKMHSNGESERLSRPSPSNSVITKIEKKSESEDMDTDDSPSNVILKIPSFKPTSSKNGHDIIYRSPSTETPSRLVSPPVTSESGSPPILPGKNLVIKDIMTQSISQKFQQSLAEPSIRRPITMDIDFKRGGFTPPMANMTSVIKSQHDLTRQFQQQHSQREPQKPQGSGQSAAGGKGTRPKRGKYRNYDRDSLVEAVRAVQRGEMSVHRAGSYYGVPHSTLEYKVKERHLMRPRKRDPKPNPVDEKIASLKQNDLRNAQEKLKPAIKPPQQKFSPTSPNGIKLPIFDAATTLNPAAAASLAGYNHPPFPFWPHPGFPHNPLEYAAAARAPGAAPPFLAPNPEFFASQMMQKLQEESSRIAGSPSPQGGSATLAKSARQMAESLLDGTGSNGSFLDGIIRSSLESGVPSADGKSSREDKNVAPEKMSNKALLDQLCRNSRLTPLPKPDPNSSGDESYRRESSPLNFSTGHDDNSSRSPTLYTKETSEALAVELSNDSNSSVDKKSNQESTERKHHPRIYIKQDLVNPDNLKPQLLVRFPELLPERNGGGGDSKTGSSASDNEAPQD